jgi:putative membrane protein
MTWERLHPLSPLVRGGRAALALLAILTLTTAQRQGGSEIHVVVDLVIVAVVALAGLVNWLVTRWAFDGTSLRIETGLLRRDVRQLPVARIQAVDVVQPLIARFFGLSELKIRVGGVSKDSRLAYLSDDRAASLRASLLAAHHGMDPATPEPPEVATLSVPTDRLLGSVALSAPTTVLAVAAVVLVVLAAVSFKAAAAAAGATFLYIFGAAAAVWRRFNEQYGFTVASAPDGIRIRRGLLGTVAETIPLRRVQAVRQIEPLWWRLIGWCRLEVDLAGVPGRDRSAGSGQVTKTLLPVGAKALSETLRAMIIGIVAFSPTPPPAKAKLKAPLSYHFLTAGHDATIAVAVTGRLRRTTCWVPLEKLQSVRRVQGPVQRALGLATVHLDVAGRGNSAAFKDRAVTEADRLVEDLAALSRVARRHALGDHQAPVAAQTDEAVSPGWFSDPSGRHHQRYWDGTRWTEHVASNGVSSTDPL